MVIWRRQGIPQIIVHLLVLSRENKDTYTHNEFISAQKQCATEYEEDHIREMIKYLKIKELREKLDSDKNI